MVECWAATLSTLIQRLSTVFSTPPACPLSLPAVAGEQFRTWLERLARLLQLKIEMMVVHATRIESRVASGARILAVQILGN